VGLPVLAHGDRNGFRQESQSRTGEFSQTVGESLIERVSKNFTVKVPEYDLSKNRSSGSLEPNEPLWCVCRGQVS